METSPKQVVKKEGLIFEVGKPTQSGYVNIIVNFNPLRKTQFIKFLEELPSVNCVTCAQRHDIDSGGFAVLLNQNYTALDLTNEIKQLLEDLIL